jgi:predicted RNase H-like HicB family nuclease
MWFESRSSHYFDPARFLRRLRLGALEAHIVAKVYDTTVGQQFQVFVEYDPSEKAWVTYVPALDHISTFGSTRDEALANTREAIVGYLEAADKEGLQLTVDPTPAELVQIAV